MGDTPSTGSIEAVLQSLGRPYRRLVPTFFDESNAERAHIDTLAEHVANGNGEPLDPERVAIALHHDAFPALADAGVVDDDRTSRTVRFGENARPGRDLAILAEIGEVPS